MRVKSTGQLQVMLVLLVGLGLGTGQAHAEAGLVVIGGTADERVRATVGAAVEGAARQAGWSLAAGRLSRKEQDGLVRCQEPTPFPCLPPSLEAGGIERVLVVTVDRATSDSGAPELVLLGKLLVTRPRDVIVNRRFCETCAEDRLAQEATTLAQDLLRLLATQSGRTVIEIRSAPTGAQIVLDGQRIGVTDASFNTFPGEHVVTLEKDGYVSEVIELTVEEGTTAHVSRRLRAAETRPPLVPPRRSRLLPGAMMAAGITAVVGGLVLFVVDQDPSPTGGKQYWDTAPAGIAIGAVGLAVGGAGAYLWRRASRQDTAPSATLARGAVVIGWSGSF
jgi:hypothetical protein